MQSAANVCIPPNRDVEALVASGPKPTLDQDAAKVRSELNAGLRCHAYSDVEGIKVEV